MGRYLRIGAATAALAIFTAAALIYHQSGLYGFNVLILRGGSYWVPIERSDPRLSDSMRLALSPNPPAAESGPFAWQQIGPGFEVAELPVLAGGREIDRILLSRIDPARYRFEVRNDALGAMTTRDWMHKLNAAFVINGSYYGKRGTPDTPFLSDGEMLGPTRYPATHGAFVAADGKTAIHDLAHQDWQSAFAGAHDALVSYPMLIGQDGASRAPQSRWLANRSFIAQDRNGLIVLGTTTNAFFTIARLADFLRNAPLDLSLALNLDGGPVACQAVSVGDYRRDFCGKWETEENDGKLSLLTWGWLKGSWALPVVIAAVPK
jgi:hypothetical protein